MTDTAVDRQDPPGIGFRVVMQRVFANVIGNGDHAVTAGHHRAVAADRIVAMHGGDEYRPGCRFETADCQAAYPGR